MTKTPRTGSRKRSCGVLLHVTSLPGPYGIGDLGPAAYRWVDALARAKQTWWQVLPLVPPGNGDSPYNGLSAFAGNPLLISPDLLRRDGLLTKMDLLGKPLREGKVDFARVRQVKGPLLDRAYATFTANRSHPLRPAFERFRHQHADWLDDFALYMALRDATGGKPWSQWDRDLMRRQPAVLREARRNLADAIDRHAFVQFLFDRQLSALREHAKSKGVRLIGDLPIFVAYDSADVWTHARQFLLDRAFQPKVVAGVPPDYFSQTGQRWGNPHYDWRAMAKDGFTWWTNRVKATLRQVDLVRLDHFRGFEACWAVPASAPTAETGRWTKTPGAQLLETFRKHLGHLPFIAEDLGVITPPVEKLRDDFALPGMRVLQFAFGGGPDNPFLPHHYARNAVAYTGTHDNDTTIGWYRSLKPQEKKSVQRYAPDAAKDVAGTLIRLAWSSVAGLAIAPLQDLLRLGADARINVPGVAQGNWSWRATDRQLKATPWAELAQWTETYSRATR